MSLIRRQREQEARDAVLLAHRIGIEPDPWQAEMLRSDAQQMILLCSRQCGKSTSTAIKSLHTAIYQPQSLILLLSASLRQSQELFRSVKKFYAALLSSGVGIIEESALRVEFDNGSRLICLPSSEATIRGFAGVDLLIVDEASRCPDALYYSIRPMLAVSGGKIVLLSTPFGKRGFFYETYDKAESWQRFKVTAEQCPRISDEFLAQERATMGDWWFRQEYMCEFVDDLSQFFSSDDISRAIDHSIAPLFGG